MSADQVCQALTDFEQTAWVETRPVICSHFANASDPEHPENKLQWQAVQALMDRVGNQYEISLANSAALLSNADYSLHWNRPGIMLYGGAPFDDIDHPLAEPLKPAMHLTTEVIAVRDIQVGETVGYGSTWTASRPSTIATLAIGYADGYPRHAPTGTPVAVNGQRVPLVGRVSMDMITVDVTGIGPVSLGDPAELWGATISIDEVAQHVGTISYDLMTAITSRVPKHYS
jgi:alanine racemase